MPVQPIEEPGAAQAGARPQLSPSSVAFLYAHRFAPAAKEGKIGTRSLANGTVVETVALSRMLVIVALWSLQEAGAVVLEPFKEKRLKFIPWNGVRVRLIEPIEIGGLEGRLLGEVARDKKARDPGMDISLLMNLLFRDGKPDAESLVRKYVVDDVAERGYAERVSTDVGAVKHAITKQSRSRLEGRDEQIGSVRQLAESVIERWNGFCGAQPELKTELIAAVRDAFNQLKRNDRDDS